MTTNASTRKYPKARYSEYYDMESTFDGLYKASKNGEVFNNLMPLIASDENIKLAYRTIKRNGGSNTPGVDKKDIRDIEKLPESTFVNIVKSKLNWYTPMQVKRVEIPKPNGKMRPLGIPTMWDRLVQQAILQVLQPICEAKFHEKSNGFRPNRSVEHAIAQCMKMMQQMDLHYVVDIDIKGFFDNVNHSKLIRQMWTLGIRDKKLICIIKAMLKAPIRMPDNSVRIPDKGTPQGGILSPLLSNIVLNELDWWVASQWEFIPAQSVKPTVSENGEVLNWGNIHRALRGSVKEMYIVRYADDFKIFCRNREDAEKCFIAVKDWLEKRLKLQISDEKSKIVNLKNSYSDFLGFKLKVVPKGNSYVVKSHICDKAMMRIEKELKDQIKLIQKPRDKDEEYRMILRYNSMVIGIHNYYQIATHISEDCGYLAWKVNKTIKNRLKQRISSEGTCTGFPYIQEHYGPSDQLRYIRGKPLAPIGYIRHKAPMLKRRRICCYTPEGRTEIHKNLGIDTRILCALMRSKEVYRSIEYMDNRISLYAAQNGKCAISGCVLTLNDIHCHHKVPLSKGGSDRYENLIILHKDIHKLVHATDQTIISSVLQQFELNAKQIKKLNMLRKQAGLSEI